MPFPFYERKRELDVLSKMSEQAAGDCSRMLVLTGRRRIGKTTLCNRAFSESALKYLFFFISSEKTEAANLEAFWRDNAGFLGMDGLPVNFATFAELMEFLLQRSASTPLVLVIDEFQNCASVAPSFMSDLQRLWDKWRKRSRMLLVLTGSVASAMREITEGTNAPLFGRASAKLILQPFPTDVIKGILTDYHADWRPEELLTLYTLAGSVPKYLELLMEARKFTIEEMISYAIEPDSFFTTEGDRLLRTEFRRDYSVYFCILERIAAGKTKRQELVSAFPSDISGQLFKLEDYFHLIKRENPVGRQKNSRNFRFVMADDYLHFWFRFIYPNLGLIQQGSTARLERKILDELPDYTGRHVLERWFRTKLWESGNFTEVGPWWDASLKGENEIDIVAINPFDKEVLFGEVKRRKSNIDLDLLKQKSFAFLSQNPEYRKYDVRCEAYGMEDM